MSRMYTMNIEVHGVEQSECPALHETIQKEWGDDDPFYNAGTKNYSTNGENALAGGESPDEFATRLAHAIWKKLERYVEVVVCSTLLEDLPYDTHILAEEAYRRWKDAK